MRKAVTSRDLINIVALWQKHSIKVVVKKAGYKKASIIAWMSRLRGELRKQGISNVVIWDVIPSKKGISKTGINIYATVAKQIIK